MSDINGNTLLKYYYLKFKIFFTSKDVLNFLLFVVVAAAFWFVNSLGKEREVEIRLPFSVANMPENILVQWQSASEVRIKIRDKGTKLLSYSKLGTALKVNENFAESGTLKITPRQFRQQLANLLPPSAEILEIKPDTVYLQYQRLESKILPVELISSITFENQFIFKDKIEIAPNKIRVYAPKSLLDTLKTVKTKLLTLRKLDKDVKKRCALAFVPMLKTDVSEVTVNIKVEKFTEKTMMLPVAIINCPQGVSIKTFPSEVKADFNIGMSRYSSVTTVNIAITLDYNEIKSNASHQTLKTKALLPSISNLRITPAEVEYIIEKKNK